MQNNNILQTRTRKRNRKSNLVSWVIFLSTSLSLAKTPCNMYYKEMNSLVWFFVISLSPRNIIKKQII